VVNSSKINWLNLTSRQGSTLEDINSVQSIAIDWLGRKIYWADPSKQSVINIFISIINCNEYLLSYILDTKRKFIWRSKRVTFSV